MSIENAEKLITDFLIKRLAPTVIYLFGSRAANFVHIESDYDIAYLSNQKLDNYERFMLAQELAAILNHDVDLINLEEASTVFQVQVISKGKTVYCSNDTEKAMFEMRTLKKYAMLNEERQEVLKNVLERGQIYEQ